MLLEVKKKAVLIFNLGGPSSLDEVEDFLFSLFFDKRILTMPKIPRYFLAKLITKLRTSKAKEIYKMLGGLSPIGKNTFDQGVALQNNLIEKHQIVNANNINWRVFYAMRHSSPHLEEVMLQMSEFDPHEVILLPLYPQYSTTTTESFFDKWREVVPKIKNKWHVRPIFDYHDNPEYINSCCDIIYQNIKNIEDLSSFRLLFSAHGLPQSIVDSGDPYQKQIEVSSKLISDSLIQKIGELDWKICYQSRVGPKKWLTPSLEDEMKIVANDGKGVIIFPISFTSEHSETLVELDIEFKELAHNLNIKEYIRVPTLSVNEKFIDCLSSVVVKNCT